MIKRLPQIIIDNTKKKKKYLLVRYYSHVYNTLKIQQERKQLPLKLGQRLIWSH